MSFTWQRNQKAGSLQLFTSLLVRRASYSYIYHHPSPAFLPTSEPQVSLMLGSNHAKEHSGFKKNRTPNKQAESVTANTDNERRWQRGSPSLLCLSLTLRQSLASSTSLISIIVICEAKREQQTKQQHAKTIPVIF